MKRRTINELPYPRCLDYNEDDKLTIVIDSTPVSEPCLNINGWPANEISLLLKLEQQGDGDSPLAQGLYRSLNMLPSPSVDNSGKSDQVIISEITPRFVGTLSEYLKYIDTLPLSDVEKSLLKENAISEQAESPSEVVDESSEG